jgi:xylan 1,4-beta-xylosidase
VNGLKSLSDATIRRIDLEHGNAKRHWEQLGKPEYLSAEMVAELDKASALATEPQAFTFADGVANFEITMPPQSVAAIQLTF